jgi:hypothetical protein
VEHFQDEGYFSTFGGTAGAGAGAEAVARRVRYNVARLQTGPQFAAVLDAIFDVQPRRTDPGFVELVLVDDRLLFARGEGECSFKHFVGPLDELIINLAGFCRHMKYGPEERAYVLGRVDAIGDAHTDP